MMVLISSWKKPNPTLNNTHQPKTHTQGTITTTSTRTAIGVTLSHNTTTMSSSRKTTLRMENLPLEIRQMFYKSVIPANLAIRVHAPLNDEMALPWLDGSSGLAHEEPSIECLNPGAWNAFSKFQLVSTPLHREPLDELAVRSHSKETILILDIAGHPFFDMCLRRLEVELGDAAARRPPTVDATVAFQKQHAVPPFVLSGFRKVQITMPMWHRSLTFDRPEAATFVIERSATSKGSWDLVTTAWVPIRELALPDDEILATVEEDISEIRANYESLLRRFVRQRIQDDLNSTHLSELAEELVLWWDVDVKNQNLDGVEDSMLEVVECVRLIRRNQALARYLQFKPNANDPVIEMIHGTRWNFLPEDAYLQEITAWGSNWSIPRWAGVIVIVPVLLALGMVYSDVA